MWAPPRSLPKFSNNIDKLWERGTRLYKMVSKTTLEAWSFNHAAWTRSNDNAFSGSVVLRISPPTKCTSSTETATNSQPFKFALTIKLDGDHQLEPSMECLLNRTSVCTAYVTCSEQTTSWREPLFKRSAKPKFCPVWKRRGRACWRRQGWGQWPRWIDV